MGRTMKVVSSAQHAFLKYMKSVAYLSRTWYTNEHTEQCLLVRRCEAIMGPCLDKFYRQPPRPAVNLLDATVWV